jgi:hypothetical protein
MFSSLTMGHNAFKLPTTFGIFIIDLIRKEEIIVNHEAFVEGIYFYQKHDKSHEESLLSLQTSRSVHIKGG